MINTSAYTDSGSVYRKVGLSSSEVGSPTIDQIILESEREMELITGRYWVSGGRTVTEWYNGGNKDIFGNKTTSFVLNNYPVLAIGSLQFIDTTGSATTTYSGLSAAAINSGSISPGDSQYWIDTAMGKIQFITDEMPVGNNNVKITYTYGTSGVPLEITSLAIGMAGIRAWVAYLGGQYNRINNYTVPEMSASKGDIYQRGMQTIESLRAEVDEIFSRIGRRKSTLAFFSGGVTRGGY